MNSSLKSTHVLPVIQEQEDDVWNQKEEPTSSTQVHSTPGHLEECTPRLWLQFHGVTSPESPAALPQGARKPQRKHWGNRLWSSCRDRCDHIHMEYIYIYICICTYI